MSTVKANTYLAASGSPTEEPSIPALDQRMAKAWVHFDGTGTTHIVKAYNVSSITDYAVGHWDISMANPMPDSDYIWVGTCMKYTQWYPCITQRSNYSKTTTIIPIGTSDAYSNTGWFDSPSVAVTVFGN